MFISFVLIFSLSALCLNFMKIKIQHTYKRIKYLKDPEFDKVLKEWDSIKLQNKGKKDSKFIEIYQSHYDTIINTKIIKRYEKYFNLDEIPLHVYKYTAFKVKDKIDQEIEKVHQEQEQDRKTQEQQYERIFKNFYNGYYSKNGGGGIKTVVSSSQHYKILGATTKDDLPTIKKKYRQKMKQYHPDKLNSLSKSDQAKGEEQSKKINEAYEYICKVKK